MVHHLSKKKLFTRAMQKYVVVLRLIMHHEIHISFYILFNIWIISTAITLQFCYKYVEHSLKINIRPIILTWKHTFWYKNVFLFSLQWIYNFCDSLLFIHCSAGKCGIILLSAQLFLHSCKKEINSKDVLNKHSITYWVQTPSTGDICEGILIVQSDWLIEMNLNVLKLKHFSILLRAQKTQLCQI